MPGDGAMNDIGQRFSLHSLVVFGDAPPRSPEAAKQL